MIYYCCLFPLEEDEVGGYLRMHAAVASLLQGAQPSWVVGHDDEVGIASVDRLVLRELHLWCRSCLPEPVAAGGYGLCTDAEGVAQAVPEQYAAARMAVDDGGIGVEDGALGTILAYVVAVVVPLVEAVAHDGKQRQRGDERPPWTPPHDEGGAEEQQGRAYLHVVHMDIVD